jgi:hypothetical protein
VDGQGGIGVHGIGGISTSVFPNAPIAGAGVVAQGGRVLDNFNNERLPHGAGVIAMAGGSGKPIPSLADTGSVGVFAQGAEAELRTVNFAGDNIVVGPTAPGAGVLGRGGVFIPPEGPVAAGVIGLAGGVPIPDISKTGNTGVYGAGSIGGRGGMFESTRSAQVHLVPQQALEPFPPRVPVGPTEFLAERGGLAGKLPKDGRGGDLLALMDNQRQCTLWFCVRGQDGGDPAQWAQVLLGSSFNGQA